MGDEQHAQLTDPPADEVKRSAAEHPAGAGGGRPGSPPQRPGDPADADSPSYQQFTTAGGAQDQAPVKRGRAKRATPVIAALAMAAAAFLILGLWKPGFLNTTKLDLNVAQRSIEQLLSDRTNGYGLTAVADVTCNNGQNPTVRPGATFTCTVSIGGSPRQVTVTFDNSAGDYTVSPPQ